MITVFYWGPTPTSNFYGRAIGIYLTLNHAGVKYQTKGKADLPPGASFAMPAVEVDGAIMGQAPFILSHLGEKYGLAGKTVDQKMRVLHALGDMNDVFGEPGKMAIDEGRRAQWFSYLEQKLEGKKWIAGTEDPTVADFHGVFAFEWVVKKGVDFSAYPNVTGWWENIKAYPTVAEMYASLVDGRRMIP